MAHQAAMTTSLAHKDVHVMKGLCRGGGFVFRSSNVDVLTVMAKNISSMKGGTQVTAVRNVSAKENKTLE